MAGSFSSARNLPARSFPARATVGYGISASNSSMCTSRPQSLICATSVIGHGFGCRRAGMMRLGRRCAPCRCGCARAGGLWRLLFALMLRLPVLGRKAANGSCARAGSAMNHRSRTERAIRETQQSDSMVSVMRSLQPAGVDRRSRAFRGLQEREEPVADRWTRSAHVGDSRFHRDRESRNTAWPRSGTSVVFELLIFFRRLVGAVGVQLHQHQILHRRQRSPAAGTCSPSSSGSWCRRSR